MVKSWLLLMRWLMIATPLNQALWLCRCILSCVCRELKREPVELSAYLRRLYDIGLTLKRAESVSFDRDIPEAQQAFVFERFRQSDRDALQRIKGAGLGLAICKEIVEKHGGQISVTSTPGEDADFMFMLPIV